LTTSNYSRIANTPVLINLDILREEPEMRLYNKENIPVACLLEGEFASLYATRIQPEIENDKNIGFLAKGEFNRMIVIADGDIIKNQMKNTDGKPIPYPLGYDRYTGQSFGNKEFILNAMNYLIDGSGLISIRSRELKLRLLDKTIIEQNRLLIQIVNTILPVVVILIVGLLMSIYRRRKYTQSI